MDPDQKFIRIQQLCGSGSTQVKIGWNRGKRSQIEDKNWKFYIKSFPLIIYLLHFSIVDKITTGSGSKLGQNSGSGSKFNALYLDPQRCFKQREKNSLRIFLQHLVRVCRILHLHINDYCWGGGLCWVGYCNNRLWWWFMACKNSGPFHLIYIRSWQSNQSIFVPVVMWSLCKVAVVICFLLHVSNPPGPLINRLKWFWWKIHFHGYIWEISDSTQTNTAWSFAGINVVFAGLCLPCKRIKKVLLHICELFQHRPAFSVTFSMD